HARRYPSLDRQAGVVSLIEDGRERAGQKWVVAGPGFHIFRAGGVAGCRRGSGCVFRARHIAMILRASLALERASRASDLNHDTAATERAATIWAGKSIIDQQ